MDHIVGASMIKFQPLVLANYVELIIVEKRLNKIKKVMRNKILHSCIELTQ
jgi:hypothetical protein